MADVPSEPYGKTLPHSSARTIAGALASIACVVVGLFVGDIVRDAFGLWTYTPALFMVLSVVSLPPVMRVARVSDAAEIDPDTIQSTSGPIAVKIEDRPLADPYLPKAARFALVLFCLAMIGALAWAMVLLWVGVLHPLPWSWTLLWFGYLGWIVWSARRKEAKQRREAKTISEKILPQKIQTETLPRTLIS